MVDAQLTYHRGSRQKSDAVRQVHAATGASVYASTVDLIKDLARNPVVELIVAIVLIERLQQNGVLSQLMGTLLEGGVAGIITAQQLAPLAPALAQGGQSVAGLIGGVGALTALPGIPPPP